MFLRTQITERLAVIKRCSLWTTIMSSYKIHTPLQSTFKWFFIEVSLTYDIFVSGVKCHEVGVRIYYEMIAINVLSIYHPT